MNQVTTVRKWSDDVSRTKTFQWSLEDNGLDYLKSIKNRMNWKTVVKKVLCEEKLIDTVVV